MPQGSLPRGVSRTQSSVKNHDAVEVVGVECLEERSQRGATGHLKQSPTLQRRETGGPTEPQDCEAGRVDTMTMRVTLSGLSFARGSVLFMFWPPEPEERKKRQVRSLSETMWSPTVITAAPTPPRRTRPCTSSGGGRRASRTPSCLRSAVRRPPPASLMQSVGWVLPPPVSTVLALIVPGSEVEVEPQRVI